MRSESGSKTDSYRKAEPRRKVSYRPGTEKGSERLSNRESHAGERRQSAAFILCPAAKKCGGCDFQGVPYAEQLRQKEERVRGLLKGTVRTIRPIIGMRQPLHYRCKVHAVFGHDRKGIPFSGIYEKDSHTIVPVESCMIEDETCDAIIGAIRELARSFRIRTYDEDTGYGFLRHVLVRKGYATGQYLVVLVAADAVFPSKNNFVKALLREHPEITSIVLNLNDRSTSMVLGRRNITLYGPGYITDRLCGHTFRISPSSFYQVNPPQTEILYRKAMEYAGLTGREEVLDAYCGTGTIGIIASERARHVTGVELNRDAVRDAVSNTRAERIRNIDFVCGDAGQYLDTRAGTVPDVIFMDPPRTGSSEKFIRAAARSGAARIVYISCGPDSLARDLKLFAALGYMAEEAQPVDLFPFTAHVETVCMLQKSN